MVTGLVGPYMVLLHTAMRFHGLAGLTMLLTVLVVASGLVGRFLYTRVPRSPETGGAAARLRDLAPRPPAAHLGAVRRRDRPRRRGPLLRDAAAVTGGDGMKKRPGFISATGYRGGRRRLPRRGRRDAPRRTRALQPRRAERPDQRRPRAEPGRRRRAAGRRHQPRPARRRVQRLPPRPVELAHHRRRLPHVPHPRGRRDQGRGRPPRPARGHADVADLHRVPPRAQRAQRGAHRARRGGLRLRARHDRVLAQDPSQDRVGRQLHLRRLPPQGLREVRPGALRRRATPTSTPPS